MLKSFKGINVKLMLAVLTMLVASLALAACGDSTTAAPVATTTTAATAAATTAATATTATATTPAATTAAVATTTAASTGTTTAASTGTTTAAASTTAGTSTTTAPATTTAAAAGTAVAGATPSNGYAIKATVALSGQGATFPKKAYDLWIGNFAKANPTVKIDYTGNGSGAGRKAIFGDQADFAGSDAYPTAKDATDAGKDLNNYLAIPTTLGGVTLSYNLSGVTGLKLSPDILGGIYTGKITTWNDEKIKAENSGVNLPNLPITLAVRADDSGTTNVFSNYLAAVSADFKALAIAGNKPDWGKAGIQVVTGDGNPGVANQVKGKEGTLGYVDFGDAKNAGLTYASVKNAKGAYVAPSPDSFSEAAAGATIPDNLQLKVSNNQDNEKAYPIASTTWIIIPKDFKDAGKAEAIATFIWWVTHDQTQIAAAKEIGFAPLPAAALPKVEAALKSVTANGTAVFK